jgi:hypothetical protein
MNIRFATDRYSVRRLAKALDADKIVANDFGHAQLFTLPDNTKRSRVIEAALLGCPLPRIFCLRLNDGTLDIKRNAGIADALKVFLYGAFRLEGLQVLHEYEGMYFKSLPPLQQGLIEDYTLDIAWTNEGIPDDALFVLCKYTVGNFA